MPVIASVPLVGNVILVAPVVLSVSVLAPVVVKFPATVIVLPPLFTPVPPYVLLITLACHTPVLIVPSCCRLEFTTSVPNVVLLSTLMLLMRYALALASSKFSLDVQLSVAFSQLIVLSIVPFNVMPPPSAVTSVGEATLPSSMFLSSTLIVVLFIVVVVPFTVRLPSTTRLLLILVVPVAEPISIVVAAPNALTVVAVVFSKLNVVTLVLISPPSTFRSPSISTLLCTVVVPVAAPISTIVAAPPMLILVAVVSNKFTVVAVVLSVPATATSPVKVALPAVLIRRRSVAVCLISPVVLVCPVLTTKLPPVALPVPMPA